MKTFLPLFFLLFFVIGNACESSKPAKRPAQSANTRPVPPKPPVVEAIPVEASANNVSWLDSERLMPVLEQATRENKPVFVEFYASWCLPCRVMEENLFTQAPVSKYLNDNFLNFRADFDSPAGRTIAEIYEVEKLPTVLFLYPNGVVVGRYTGVPDLRTLMKEGDPVLLMLKK